MASDTDQVAVVRLLSDTAQPGVAVVAKASKCCVFAGCNSSVIHRGSLWEHIDRGQRTNRVAALSATSNYGDSEHDQPRDLTGTGAKITHGTLSISLDQSVCRFLRKHPLGGFPSKVLNL